MKTIETYRGFEIRETGSTEPRFKYVVHWHTDNRDFNHHETVQSARMEIDAIHTQRAEAFKRGQKAALARALARGYGMSSQRLEEQHPVPTEKYERQGFKRAALGLDYGVGEPLPANVDPYAILAQKVHVGRFFQESRNLENIPRTPAEPTEDE